jgi:hypothetical protein
MVSIRGRVDDDRHKPVVADFHAQSFDVNERRTSGSMRAAFRTFSPAAGCQSRGILRFRMNDASQGVALT